MISFPSAGTNLTPVEERTDALCDHVLAVTLRILAIIDKAIRTGQLISKRWVEYAWK